MNHGGRGGEVGGGGEEEERRRGGGRSWEEEGVGGGGEDSSQGYSHESWRLFHGRRISLCYSIAAPLCHPSASLPAAYLLPPEEAAPAGPPVGPEGVDQPPHQHHPGPRQSHTMGA